MNNNETQRVIGENESHYDSPSNKPIDRNDLIHIHSRLDDIEKSLIEIKTLIQCEVTSNCKKMASHVDFVETVYENVKQPLSYALGGFFRNNMDLPDNPKNDRICDKPNE